MNFKNNTGFLSLLLGIFYLANALMIKKASIGNPLAPKVFPVALGILMVVFSVILIIRESKARKASGEKISFNFNFDQSSKQIAITSVACILYALIFNKLGFVISTVIFLEIILTLFNGMNKYKINTIVAMSFSIGIYFVFSSLLGIILPPMPFLNI